MKKTLLTKKKHKVYNEVDIIITNSNYMRDKIIKEFEITQPEKIKVVYPPIDISLHIHIRIFLILLVE
ncbi:glycosyltransferase [Klebsiella pneumoniae]|uniref:glycosyltransferase n=1 Tax=Klebsiella pneumoniae TaxID=573 RepID=UPI0037BE6224